MAGQVYFSSQPYLKARMEAIGRQMGLRAQTLEELALWRNELRVQLRRVTGIDTMRRTDPNPRVTERVACQGYTRERVEMETEPGITMPFYVLLPADLRPGERRAAVIAPHGHGSCGKSAVAGIRDHPAVAQTIDGHNYDYGVQFVRRGVVVFCPDARGFGERREPAQQGDAREQVLDSSCREINNMAIPLGQTVTGMWAWDLMRLVDYAQTRPECDPQRIGCAGLSGGGLQTLWLTALDERVRCAVDSGYFYGYKEALLLLNGNCSCNYVPGLWELADMGDIAALIAPRPFFVETGDADPLNGPRGLPNVYEQVAIARRAYALFGAEASLVHEVCAGEHRWYGERAVPWMVEQLAKA